MISWQATSSFSIQYSEDANEMWNQYQKIINSYKQISLTMEYDSYIKGCMSRMMWGHYGQKGDGVCIELDPECLDLSNTFSKAIRYSNTPLSLPILPVEYNETEMNHFVLENKDLIFFTKTEDWSGENEYRIISNNLDSLDISRAIKAVYVTDCFSLTCKCIEEIAKDVEVKFFYHHRHKDWLVPRVSSSIKYRDSLKPRKENIPLSLRMPPLLQRLHVLVFQK